MKRFLVGALVIGLLGVGLNFLSLRPAEGHGSCGPPPCPPARRFPTRSPTKMEGYESIVGEIICPSCILGETQGAESQCSIYGCPLALRLDDGRILTFLENDKSTELVRNKDKMRLTTFGKGFKGSRSQGFKNSSEIINLCNLSFNLCNQVSD